MNIKKLGASSFVNYRNHFMHYLKSFFMLKLSIIVLIVTLVGRMFLIGFAQGPINHAWYTFLDRAIKGSAGQQVFRKIILDQIIASPFFAWFFFMGKRFYNFFVVNIPFLCPAPMCPDVSNSLEVNNHVIVLNPTSVTN